MSFFEDALAKPIEVVYQDDQCMVFNKPAGLLVIPTPRNEKNTLQTIVNAQYTKEGEGHLHPCHRLDRETSGLILFARGKKNQQMMMDLFHKHQIRKTYLAFIQGRLMPLTGELRGQIKDLEDKKFRRNAPGQLAISRYRVSELKKDFSVVMVEPITGRTNQIRIQFAQIRHPLLGERKYAFGKDFKVKFRRVALHAYALEWTHPVSKRKIKISVNMPKDMEEFLARHRN